MSHRLAPCPVCARHVRLSEAACPFCGGPLEALASPPAPRVVPRGLLTRAAIVLGAAMALGSACGDDAPASGGDTTGGEQPPDDDGAGAPEYGAPATPPDDDGGSAAEYGAPASPPDDDGGSAAEYGVPAIPEEG